MLRQEPLAGTYQPQTVERIYIPKPNRKQGLWVIKGDLSSDFDTVHHRLLMRVVRRRIRDRRFLTLLWRFLKAGHVDRE